MTPVEIKHLCCEPIIHDVELQIDVQSAIALVAPSGAGKTFLLKMIAGLEPVDAGDVLVDGRSVIGLPPRERGIALVPANMVLYPHMTAYENIAFGLKLAKLPRVEIDRRVREAARVLEISGLLDRNPHGLTPDKRPLVAIGRAIARRPAVLLLDEPLGALEGAGRAGLLAALARLHERLGTATVLATRHRREAASIGRTLMTLAGGRIIPAEAPDT